MFKKSIIVMMTLFAVGFGFVSCSNNVDDGLNNVDEDYSSYYGTFEGSVMNQEVTLTISKSSVDQGGNYGAYTKVLWLTDSDGKAVVAAQSDSTNTKNGDLTEENYTTAASCYIVFGSDSSATYYVPAMATMMPDGAAFYRVETLSVDATLSCYVSAMGGVEFGTPIYKSTTIKKRADGTVKATLNFGTGTGNIYGVEFNEFVDPSDSTPGYYDADGNVINAEYTVSSDDDVAYGPSANVNVFNGKYYQKVSDESDYSDDDYIYNGYHYQLYTDTSTGVNYVTSMTFPVSEETSEYNLWIYINSNVMGVQFCDGSGTSSSNHPNEATPYVGKLTIDWDSLK